jgi:hypothetical protein
MNYMDYTDDRCMNMFSTGQSTRMNALFASGGARASITLSSGCNPVSGCASPSGVTVSNITGTGATISWTAASGATGYTVTACIAGTTNCVTANTTSTSTTLTNLTGNTSYTVNVTATCSAGTSTPATTNFTTLATSCGNPTGLTTSSVSSSGATLSWTAVTGALSYNIQYKTSTATTWTTVTSVTASRILTGLSASTTYNWQVQSVCNGISGTYVAGTNFTTTAPPACSAPSGLSAGSISSSGATLTWTAVTGALSYNIQYKTSAAASWTTVTSTTNSRTLTGLTASTIYNWQVQTVCSGSTSTYTAGTNFTTLASTTCTDAYETNNTSTAAKTISINTDIKGLINTGSDVDWFKFSTTSPNTYINVTLSTLPTDYDLNLYNSSLSSIIGQSLNPGTTSESITYNTTAASTYYLKIFPFTTSNYNASQCYTLRVNTRNVAYRLDAGGNIVPVVENKDISIYPNPVHEILNVNLKNNNRATISIIDINGKEALRQTTSSPNNRISLMNLSSGMYLIKVSNENGQLITSQKFIKN